MMDDEDYKKIEEGEDDSKFVWSMIAIFIILLAWILFLR